VIKIYQDKKILGIIPARAGSKGIPGKNIKPLAGKPLIIHTIKAALASGVFDFLLVSTDGEDIAEASLSAGAEVPFLRPAELATDSAKSSDVLRHAMAWCESRGKKFDWVAILQPTSPLRSSEDIINSCKLMIERQAKAVVSVCETAHHSWLINTLPDDHCLEHFIRPEANQIRQQLPVFYLLNGAIYLIQWDYFLKNDSFYGPQTYAYIMPKERSVDIDTPLDFALAEVLLADKN
jgi:N-acylneuraminate cytidylyltransferase/CMP-N,N'-diacetyllegionaminic acid synthase